MAKAQATPKALRQLLNERTTEYFAAAMCSLIGLFIICHWSRILYCRFRSRNHRGSVETLTSHLLRRGHDILCYRLVIVRLSVGRVLLYLTYWAVNLILYPTSVDLTNLVNIAKHCGWIALVNVCLVIFLSMKNTPLAILSTSSYDKLMPLHKVSGYTAIVAAWIHAIVYLEAWAQTANLHSMLEVNNIAGVMGGIALLLIGVSTLSYVRERLYEAFYIVHIILSTFIIIVVGLHRPNVGQHALIVTCVMASMAFLDKAIRLVRYFVTSMGNHATLTALPNGATRVRLHRYIRSAPGSHVFLWLPAIRLTQSHPFTLVSTNPVEFVVRSHRGFTSDLYQYAQKHGQDKKIRCALNGPYGLPTQDLALYDSVLLVAGGSGASFTFAVGLNLARGISIRENPMRFLFIWVVRTKSCLSWFQQELDELLMSSVVDISIYVTDEQVTEKIGLSSKDRMIISEITESGSGSGTPVFPPPDNCVDIEKKAIATATTRKSPLDLDIKSGRPKVKALVDEFVTNESSPANRVIVGACGPLSLMDAVRATASDYSKKAEGPSVTFYHEEFGW